MGKLLIIVGLFFIFMGFLLTYKISIPFIGKLPGDFSWKGENIQLYFPFASCLIISVILTLLIYLFSGKSN